MGNNNQEIFKQFLTEELIQQLNEVARQAVHESAIEINKETLVQQAMDRQKQILAALESGLTTGLPLSETKRSLVDLKESKDQWVKDVIDILSPASSGATQQAAIKRITNKWTRMNGDYIGCKYWTINALEKYKELGSPTKETGFSKYFVHEHAMPQNAFIKIFLKPQNHFAILALLYNGLNGVVVTKDENNKINKKYQSVMPRSFSDPKIDRDLLFLNPWARYIELGMQEDIQLCVWDEKKKVLISHHHHDIRWDCRIDQSTNLK